MGLALYWTVIEQEFLFQEFKILQDVAVNKSQNDAGHQISTKWNFCKEILEEEADLLPLGKGYIL